MATLLEEPALAGPPWNQDATLAGEEKTTELIEILSDDGSVEYIWSEHSQQSEQSEEMKPRPVISSALPDQSIEAPAAFANAGAQSAEDQWTPEEDAQLEKSIIEAREQLQREMGVKAEDSCEAEAADVQDLHDDESDCGSTTSSFTICDSDDERARRSSRRKATVRSAHLQGAHVMPPTADTTGEVLLDGCSERKRKWDDSFMTNAGVSGAACAFAADGDLWYGSEGGFDEDIESIESSSDEATLSDDEKNLKPAARSYYKDQDGVYGELKLRAGETGQGADVAYEAAQALPPRPPMPVKRKRGRPKGSGHKQRLLAAQQARLVMQQRQAMLMEDNINEQELTVEGIMDTFINTPNDVPMGAKHLCVLGECLVNALEAQEPLEELTIVEFFRPIRQYLDKEKLDHTTAKLQSLQVLGVLNSDRGMDWPVADDEVELVDVSPPPFSRGSSLSRHSSDGAGCIGGNNGKVPKSKSLLSACGSLAPVRGRGGKASRQDMKRMALLNMLKALIMALARQDHRLRREAGELDRDKKRIETGECILCDRKGELFVCDYCWLPFHKNDFPPGVSGSVVSCPTCYDNQLLISAVHENNLDRMVDLVYVNGASSFWAPDLLEQDKRRVNGAPPMSALHVAIMTANYEAMQVLFSGCSAIPLSWYATLYRYCGLPHPIDSIPTKFPHKLGHIRAFLRSHLAGQEELISAPVDAPPREDVSRGAEAIPIPWEGSDDDPPPPFLYISRTVPERGVEVDWSRKPKGCHAHHAHEAPCGCERNAFEARSIVQACNGHHRESDKRLFCCNYACACGQPAGLGYFDQRSVDVWGKRIPTHICGNRLEEIGLARKVVLFKTKRMGWGVRADEAIGEGAFVCAYAAKLQPEGASYGSHFNLSIEINGRKSLYTYDASHMGCIMRFVNNSCSPNLHVVYFMSNHADLQGSVMAFFARRSIRGGEELTFSYGTFRNGSCLCDKCMDVEGHNSHGGKRTRTRRPPTKDRDFLVD